MKLTLWATALACSALADAASAQFNNQWLTLVRETQDRIVYADGSPHAALISDSDEKDFAVGDLDRDGWDDVVAVRKVPVGFPGKRPGYLLMNRLLAGERRLADLTAALASASSLAGDPGLLTPADSRDVEIADFTGDGWPDVVTVQQDLANENGHAFQHLTHPRFYVNLGADVSGQWLGLRYEDARSPALFVNGLNGTVRFYDSTAGDIDQDGDIDLFCSDFDLTENGFPEPAGTDLNSRLLLNDGNGYFIDSGTGNISATWLTTTFGKSCEIADLNGDKLNDVTRVNYLTSQLAIHAIYNDSSAATLPNGPGQFDALQTVATGTPTEHAVADLNNDGRPDIVEIHDGADGYRFNTGNDALNRAVFTPKQTFTYLLGSSDTGFAGSTHAVDLNVDGWMDLFVADVDGDLLGCNRRTKLLHNLGGLPGATDIVLREEKQQSGSGGWFGAVGLLPSDMTGGFDGAFPDIDRDGDPDFLFGECNGTSAWMNQTNPLFCAADLGFKGPGGPHLSLCGAPLYSGNSATLSITGGKPNALTFFMVAAATNPQTFVCGTLAAFPIASVFAVPLQLSGTLAFPVAGGAGEFEATLQAISTDPALSCGYSVSNAIRIQMHP